MHKLVKTLHFGITRPHSFRAIKTSKSQLFPLNLFMVNLGILLNKAWGLKNGGGGSVYLESSAPKMLIH